MSATSIITLDQKHYDLKCKITSLHPSDITLERWVEMATLMRDFLDWALQKGEPDITRHEIFRMAVGYLAKGPKASVTTRLLTNHEWRKASFYSAEEADAMQAPFNEALGFLKDWCMMNDGDEPQLESESESPARRFWPFCRAFASGEFTLFKPNGAEFMFRKGLFAQLSACFPTALKPIVSVHGLTEAIAQNRLTPGETEVVKVLSGIKDEMRLNNRLHGADNIDARLEDDDKRKGRRRTKRTDDQDTQEREIISRYKAKQMKGLWPIVKEVLKDRHWQLPEGYPATDKGIKLCHDRVYALTHPRL